MSDQPAAASSPAVLHKLARAHLSASETLFPPKARGPVVLGALARCAYGLRHYEGEHVVACRPFVDASAAFEGFVLTDRVVMTRFGQERAVAPVALIKDARLSEGLLESKVVVEVEGRAALELPVFKGGDKLVGFFKALAASNYRPGRRRVPAVSVKAADPTGVRHLVEALKAPDDRVVALCHLLFDGLEAERIDVETGRDLCVRIQVLHRCLAFGRGSADGAWVSPLREDDLGWLMPSLFSHKVTRHGSHRGVELQVRLVEERKDEREGSSSGGLGKSLEDKLITSLINRVAESTLGGEVLGLLGAEVESLRVLIEDGVETEALVDVSDASESSGAGGSMWSALRRGLPGLADQLLGRDRRSKEGALASFTLEGYAMRRHQDLAGLKPDMVADLSARLVSLEVRALTCRVLDGWEATPEVLLKVSDEALRGRLSAALPARLVAALM